MTDTIATWLLGKFAPVEAVALLIQLGLFLSALGYFLHWLDGQLDGRIPDAWYGWMLKVAVLLKRLTPSGLGRETARMTNPESLTAARSDDILGRALAPKAAPKAGDIAAAAEEAARARKARDFSGSGN